MKQFRPYVRMMLGAAALGLVAGCAANPPQILMEARKTYSEAKSGQTAQFAPAALHDAKQALDKANQAFDEDPGAAKTMDLAYIAHRKALLAKAQADIEIAQRVKKEAEDALLQAQAQRAQSAEQELAQTREQLAQAERERQMEQQRFQSEQQLQQERFQTQQQMQSTTQQLEAERQARLAAEQRAEEAMRQLEEAGQVREEQRGMVITIPGNVLFASGQWTLSATAQSKLDQVANALQGLEERNIIIEGHTDSVGSEQFNMDLSQKRAESVKDYLSVHGVPAERIRTIGLGESRPVAENSSPEGRALNRRVEIIVERERAALR